MTPQGSWPRTIELLYWPTLQMMIWGFMSQFLRDNSSYIAQAFGVLLAAVMLWDLLFRSQLGLSISFLEEMWARNLGNLFVSPLRPIEHVLSMTAMGLIRTVIGVGAAALLAIPLYGYSIFGMGWPLLAFFANLIVMGWSVGLVSSGIVLRYGLGAESMAWIAIFAVQPISGVYYPIETLPVWLQYVAAILPSSHVFEGMRSVLFDHVFRVDLLLHAVLLNVVYLTAGFVSFLAFFKIARVRGQLLHVGE